MSTIRFRNLALTAVIALGLPVRTLAADTDVEPAYEKLVAEREATLVTVKFVLKVKMGGMFGGAGDQESEEEVGGLMIEPGGLVLVSNTNLGGFAAMMGRMLGGMGGDISAVPTDLKVLIGDDTEGLEAELLARDTELDLAWVRIKEPGEKTFAALDLAKSAKPSLGQRLLTISRMGKYYDRATVVNELRVAGFTRKPRELIVPGGSGAQLGAPVYTTDGKLVGVMILQLPDAGDSGGSPLGMLSQMSEMEGAMTGLILPAERVLKATTRAKETVAEAESEESADAVEEDAEPDAD
jgi:hypothetical protein